MTPPRLMRTLSPSRLLRAPTAIFGGYNAVTTSAKVAGGGAWRCDSNTCPSNCRCFAQVNDLDKIDRDLWFSSTAPRATGEDEGRKPPDERTLQLGKTVRILHERLPTLLQSPLPSETLSPQITLHLFPSTHPHLPTVSGRIAYIAALWTAPMAWGRVPLVGNVKLTILSERMVRNGGTSSADHGLRDEKLIVKWKTCDKARHRPGSGGLYRGVGLATKDPVDRIKDFISGTAGVQGDNVTEPDKASEEFCGIFIFEFDEAGRIVKHTIEHTEQGGRFDHAPRMISVTDWLLGRLNGKNKDHIPELAMCEERPGAVDRRRRFD